ncbi:hypothetical protein CJ301_12150 [Limimaricola cinnabarinus]|uniref:Uncharacterized protein n=1 Tax=Limimaricola cinnabarinus TaxID=1125964 RepID=A0A2G1MES4_9RHOB|nr:hypothetical protein CJ301_12150 [Limimaricola cinnabarinus]
MTAGPVGGNGARVADHFEGRVTQVTAPLTFRLVCCETLLGLADLAPVDATPATAQKLRAALLGQVLSCTTGSGLTEAGGGACAASTRMARRSQGGWQGSAWPRGDATAVPPRATPAETKAARGGPVPG